jgi:hypothetical protein
MSAQRIIDFLDAASRTEGAAGLDLPELAHVAALLVRDLPREDADRVCDWLVSNIGIHL